MKQLLSLFLTLCLALGTVTIALAEEQKDYVLTEMQAGENQVLVYYPLPNADADLGVNTTCTAPVFMIFGDAAFDEAAADAFAKNSDLAGIAGKEGSSLVFINPVNESWSEADAAVYPTLAQMISDSSDSEHHNGITNNFNPFTQQVSLAITGSQQRIYVYGEGKGADFVAANMLKRVDAPTFWGGMAEVTPTSVTVNGLTTVDSVEQNDITVASVGNSEEINAVLQDRCGSLLIAEAADYPAQYAQAIGIVRRQAGKILPVLDYAAEGITDKVETFTVTTSKDNTGIYAGTENHPISVVTYYANDLDVQGGNVPLVLCFHGGGNTALYEAEATEWPLIGKQYGFITVSVDLHYPNCSATELVELIDLLKQEYSIDSSRIYASGFSMGGVKSWDLYEQYPTVFAGIAPMDASYEVGLDTFNNPVENQNQDVIVPVFYVGGEASPLAELPVQSDVLVRRIAYLLKTNQVNAEYPYTFENKDAWANPIWGVDSELKYQVTDQKVFTDSIMTILLLPSADGVYYTALASSGNQAHEVYARNTWAAWDFLSQFSRNEDGSISVQPVTYALPSDDGAINGNSYNQ